MKAILKQGIFICVLTHSFTLMAQNTETGGFTQEGAILPQGDISPPLLTVPQSIPNEWKVNELTFRINKTDLVIPDHHKALSILGSVLTDIDKNFAGSSNTLLNSLMETTDEDYSDLSESIKKLKGVQDLEELTQIRSFCDYNVNKNIKLADITSSLASIDKNIQSATETYVGNEIKTLMTDYQYDILIYSLDKELMTSRNNVDLKIDENVFRNNPGIEIAVFESICSNVPK